MGLGLGTGFGAGTTVFSPPQLGALLWLPASAYSAGTVADQSGSGDTNRNATQPTVGKRPTLNAVDAGYNNQTTLTFAKASAQSLQTGTWAPAPSQPYTVFLVGNVSGVGTESMLDGFGANRALFQSYGAATLFYAGAFLSGAPSVSTKSIICLVVAPASAASIFINARTAQVTGDAGAQAFTGLTIGSDIDGASNAMDGKFAELIVYPGALSLSNRAKNWDYLAAKYGVTVGA